MLLSSSYRKGERAERRAAEWLGTKYHTVFSKKSLPVGRKSNDALAMHSFDLVSEDNEIVVEVKSHRLTRGGNSPSGKISDTYQACSMLERAKAKEKLLILTDSEFCALFKRYSDGKISREIEIVFLAGDAELSEPKTLVSSRSLLGEAKLATVDFGVFWAGFASWLSEKRTIANWTADSGKIGRDFEAGPICGNYVEVYSESTHKRQRVPKKDFKLMYEKWAPYLRKETRRGELAKQSRFTKYTISIIHEYMHLSR